MVIKLTGQTVSLPFTICLSCFGTRTVTPSPSLDSMGCGEEVSYAESSLARSVSLDRSTFIECIQIENIVQLERWEMRSESAHRAARWREKLQEALLSESAC